MSHINVKQAVFAILSKGMTTEEALARVKPEEQFEVECALASIADGLEKSREPLVKFSNNQQWSLEKTIKPGGTINYKDFNRPKKTPEAQQATLTYNSADPKAAPAYTPPKEHAPSMKNKRIEAAIANKKRQRDLAATSGKANALDVLKERQKAMKAEGVNEDVDPVHAGRMTAKSDAEPHKDDAHHEDKEKKKAKKIKDEAESLLDMHKQDGPLIEPV